MDRLEQIKNEVIQEDGNYRDWGSYMDDQPYGASDYMVNEVARRYATEVAQHNLERAAENASLIDPSMNIKCKSGHGFVVDKESITSLKIELI